MKPNLSDDVGDKWFVYLSSSCFIGISPVYHIYPTPLLGQDMTQGHFLCGV